MLEEINYRVRKAGYVPDTANVLIDEQVKEHLLSKHCEKIVMAYGLITTGQGIPIRIVKNLPICLGSYSFEKIVSKLYSMDITVRDNEKESLFTYGSRVILVTNRKGIFYRMQNAPALSYQNRRIFHKINSKAETRVYESSSSMSQHNLKRISRKKMPNLRWLM
ncbi:putative DYW domain-containing protein [Lupinus albus]|uniref:Putative DYW domain-containing protein n=1 Tax=Lupinus albus TaxID=3870 RepID=A0A6A4QHX1_LUPAL|nr:putative DYW domain-containing protein [Lupinus albus]